MNVEYQQDLDGKIIVLLNGYQWGNDDAQFDFALGCSGQVFETVGEAAAAIEEVK